MDCGLSSDSLEVRHADGAIVFCREDPRMALTTEMLYRRGLLSWIVLTGGLGKDSGPKSKDAGSEAAYQKKILVEKRNIWDGIVFLEQTATNGAENTRRSIGLIQAGNQIQPKQFYIENGIILVMPPRSARRLFAAHTKIARDEFNFSCSWQVVTINDPFDPDNPAQAKEVLQELLCVADWPKKDWADPQPDLPQDLVSWSREVLPSLDT